MSPKQIRVLLLEPSTGRDSGIASYLSSDPIMDVVGRLAAVTPDGESKVQMASLAPDVIIVDVMDNSFDLQETLDILSQLSDAKVIGVFTPNSEEKVFAGRLYSFVERSRDCAGSNLETVYERLKYQIKNARLTAMTEKYGTAGKWATLPVLPARKVESNWAETDCELIAIGASAGGTEAILTVLSALPAGMPPILVVQHMPCDFVEMFSKHLSSKCQMEVRLVSGGEKLVRGVISLTAEDRHLTVKREGSSCVIQCVDAEKVSGHRPSVDMLFSSAASAVGNKAIGVILTGMGTDGAKGLLQMHETGAYTIGQDAHTSAVYGMPAAAYELGGVTKQLPLNKIADELIKRVYGRSPEVKA